MRFHEKRIKPYRRKRRRRREYMRLSRLEGRAVEVPSSASSKHIEILRKHKDDFGEMMQ